MNQLELAQGNQLLNKIRLDMEQGYKVLGKYANQVDIVRVWCRSGGDSAMTEKLFGIVATSGLRFNNPTSFLEVQSFGSGNNFKISFLLLNNKLHEVSAEEISKGETYTLQQFIADFLISRPDNVLTLERLEAEGHNPKDLERYQLS